MRSTQQKLLSFLLLVTLGLPASAAPRNFIEVIEDPGGYVDERIALIDALEAKDVQIRITGVCISSCTLFLGAKDVCVSPSAQLGFHGPTRTLSGIPLVPRDFERISLEMANYYPEPLKSWFIKEGRFITTDYYNFTGREIIALGAKKC